MYMFHVCTDKLYVYPCRYNYRPDHCMYMSVCKSAESQGVAVLHGSRGSFHAEKQPAFRAIYRAMEEVESLCSHYLPAIHALQISVSFIMNTKCTIWMTHALRSASN